MTAGPEVGAGLHVDEGAWRFRVRLMAGCVLLVGLAMVQSPGLLVPDTKLDLAIDPLDFLRRAAHLWDAEGAFGQLQNQAYGYLWPMGPFFVLGWLVDLPGWVVQRLWLALVMAVAFTGAAKVSRALGVRSDLACIAAGFAFALSPRMLTTIGPISIEAWPSALAPWVLLPLVVGATRGSPRRAAALSALAIAMVGGVNAAATAAVLPLGALWLLTRTPGPRRRSMMLWWPVFTLLGTLWWLVPLFVMGAYSPPFLDYIESAANTTFPTTLFDALRGTSNWVPYVDSSSRAGNDLIRESYLVLNSGVVLVAGLVGLMLRRNPHRLFLVSGVLVGLFLVTMGHTGAVQGWFAPQIQELLDGPLAPLRNVHKFDPVIRLPMVIGLAWTLDALVARAAEARDGGERLNLRVLAGVVVFAVAAASVPAVAGRVTPAGGFESIPGYWHEAADWLAEEQDQGVALLLPGSSFGRYTWGTPRDEPLQVLGAKPWAVRNAVPLTPPGNIRMLDAIEQSLAGGRGSSGLADYLRRSGISHLVVRNDLERSGDILDPVLVHATLAGSPGISRVATFGPEIGGEAHLQRDGRRILVNGGWQDEYPALEVFEVSGQRSYATSGTGEPTMVVGGPEDLLDLADLGLVADEPTLLAGDAPNRASVGRVVLTDGRRARERHFGRLHDNASETLTAGQPPRLKATVRDYLLSDTRRWSTFATYEGIEGVTASTSVSDPSAAGEAQPGGLPFAAIDGRLETAWESARFGRDAHWWRVDLSRPAGPGAVSVTAGPDEDQEIVLRTPAWTSDPVQVDAGETASVTVPSAFPWLRVEDASGRDGTRLALAEVDVPGVTAERVLVLPDLPRGVPSPEVVVLRAVDEARSGCVEVDAAVRCVPERQSRAEEPYGFVRRLSLDAAARYPLSLTVRPIPAAVSDLVLGDSLVQVHGSTTANPDTRATAVAAVDGDLATTWTAASDDLLPTLSLNWLGPRTIRGLDLTVADDTAARLPEKLLLRWPGGRREVDVDDDGHVDLRPIRTQQLTLSAQAAESVTSLGFDGSGFDVPTGITELEVEGLPFLPLAPSQQTERLPCGSGPDVNVNGTGWQTAVLASPAEILAGESVPAELCAVDDDVVLAAGENRIAVEASESFTPAALVLGETSSSAATPVGADLVSPVRRQLERSDDLVATRENANPGWRSTGGREPVVVDGWRQGWVAAGEAPDSGSTMSFSPDGTYRWGLVIGLVALVVLVVVSAFSSRGRRRDLPGHVERALGVGPTVLLAVGAGALLAGPWGLLAALVGAAAALASSAVGRWAARAALPAALAASVAAYTLRPVGAAEGWAGELSWPAYLVVLASCGALATVPLAGSVRRRLSLRRRAGISTVR